MAKHNKKPVIKPSKTKDYLLYILLVVSCINLILLLKSLK